MRILFVELFLGLAILHASLPHDNSDTTEGLGGIFLGYATAEEATELASSGVQRVRRLFA